MAPRIEHFQPAADVVSPIKELHPWFNGDYQVILKDGTKPTMSSSYKQKLKSFRRATM